MKSSQALKRSSSLYIYPFILSDMHIGTLFIEESNDMNSWTTVSSLVVKAKALGETEWVHLTKRYFRFRYANGNLQQSEFLLYQSLGAGEEDININHTVPITAVAPFSVQLDKSGLTDDGRLKVQTEGLKLSSLDTQSKTMDIVFHDKTETIGEGNPFTVGSFKTLLIEVYGTAETSELKFWGKSLSGTKRALRGQKVDDGTFATSTKGKSEAWSFNITGFKEIVMELTALTNGNFSVRGTAVS